MEEQKNDFGQGSVAGNIMAMAEVILFWVMIEIYAMIADFLVL